MLLVWDEPKRRSNIQVHGLDFADARDRFEWETALVAETYPDPVTAQERFAAVGWLDDRLVFLVFALLGTEALSAISLRVASRRERRRYAAKGDPE